MRENFALAGTVELHKTTVLALKVHHFIQPAFHPPHLLQYNPVYNTVISCEERGLLNYWSGSAPSVDVLVLCDLILADSRFRLS